MFPILMLFASKPDSLQGILSDINLVVLDGSDMGIEMVYEVA